MNKSDENRVFDFLSENLNIFEGQPDLIPLQDIASRRGGELNPYGIPTLHPEGFVNIENVVEYLSSIFPSTPGKNPIDYVQGWVQIGIGQTLSGVLRSNGNALERYLLEQLIQTQKGEEMVFYRPPLELDRDHSVDLGCTMLQGFGGKGINLGIQMTTSPTHHKRFSKKVHQIISVNQFLRDSYYRQFGHKKPHVMSIIHIGGRLANAVRNEGNSIFCRDLGLPVASKQIPFKVTIHNEAQDIADFIRDSIAIWDLYYEKRQKYHKLQHLSYTGRDGKYKFKWKYVPDRKHTIFWLEKKSQLISYFQILDTISDGKK